MAIPNDEVFLKKKFLTYGLKLFGQPKFWSKRDLSADHGIKADQHGWLPGIPNRA